MQIVLYNGCKIVVVVESQMLAANRIILTLGRCATPSVLNEVWNGIAMMQQNISIVFFLIIIYFSTLLYNLSIKLSPSTYFKGGWSFSRWTLVSQFLLSFVLHLFQNRIFRDKRHTFYRLFLQTLPVTPLIVSNHWKKLKAMTLYQGKSSMGFIFSSSTIRLLVEGA